MTCFVTTMRFVPFIALSKILKLQATSISPWPIIISTTTRLWSEGQFMIVSYQ